MDAKTAKLDNAVYLRIRLQGDEIYIYFRLDTQLENTFQTPAPGADDRNASLRSLHARRSQ